MQFQSVHSFYERPFFVESANYGRSYHRSFNRQHRNIFKGRPGLASGERNIFKERDVFRLEEASSKRNAPFSVWRRRFPNGTRRFPFGGGDFQTERAVFRLEEATSKRNAPFSVWRRRFPNGTRRFPFGGDDFGG